jgi:hypothetical protein
MINLAEQYRRRCKHSSDRQMLGLPVGLDLEQPAA